MITKYIKRHSVLARITHGVVAISCILLAISGLFVLITAWNNGMGSEFTIAMRWTHRLLAIPFILIPLLAIIISPKGFVHLFKNNIFGKWDADDRTFAMRFIPYLFAPGKVHMPPQREVKSLQRVADGTLLFAGVFAAISEQMNSQAKRTSDIVEHVRSYAKHKANRSEVFNLVEVIRHAINSINKEEIEGVQTTANLPQEAIAVGDSFEIELAVLNVLKNALKAAKNSLNPQTSVSVTAQKHMWKITITDNGPKISEEIFSALGRPTSTSKKDGLGVGLSIVLSIIENNGGHLTFRRIEPNGIAVDLFVKKKEE